MLILATILGWGGMIAAIGAIIYILKVVKRKVPPVEVPPDGTYTIRTISVDESTGNRKVEFTPVEK